MIQKKKLLKNTSIYLIVDLNDKINRSVLFNKTKKSLESGVKIVQLRAKDISDRIFFQSALELIKIVKEHRALFIINDRIDICLLSKADGVHLGQDDLDIKYARAILQKRFLIGASTRTVKQAKLAEKQGADYIGFGPIFKTSTKPALKPIGPQKINNLIKSGIKIPFFIIGGIKPENVSRAIKHGSRQVAVSSAIINSKNIKKTINNFKFNLLERGINDPAGVGEKK